MLYKSCGNHMLKDFQQANLILTKKQFFLHNIPAAFISTSSCCSKQIHHFTAEDIIDEELSAFLPPVLRYLEDKRIIYNSYINRKYLPMPYYQKLALMKVNIKVQKDMRLEKSIPLVVQDNEVVKVPTIENISKEISDIEKRTESFPFTLHTPIASNESSSISSTIDYANVPDIDVRQDMKERMEEYKEGIIKPISLTPHLKTEPVSEESEQFLIEEDAKCDEDMHSGFKTREPQHGTADPTIPVSNVPCGGCGALLHCQDPALPGNSSTRHFNFMYCS